MFLHLVEVYKSMGWIFVWNIWTLISEPGRCCGERLKKYSISLKQWEIRWKQLFQVSFEKIIGKTSFILKKRSFHNCYISPKHCQNDNQKFTKRISWIKIWLQKEKSPKSRKPHHDILPRLWKSEFQTSSSSNLLYE